MSVRLSQFYTQVVGTPDQSSASLTCNRLYVDVLIKNPSSLPTTHNESVNQAISFVSTASGIVEAQYTSSNLTLLSTAVTARTQSLSVSDVLGLTSLGGRSLPVSASSTLNFASGNYAFNYVADRNPVGNVLNFTQTVTNYNTRTVDHDLGITQTVLVQGPIKPYVSHSLGIRQHVSTPHRRWISDTLGVSQLVGIPLPTQHLSHTINFVHDSPIGHAESVLSFVQAATFGFSHTVSQNVAITDQVSPQWVFIREVTHNNFIGHALTWYEDGPCERKQYTPFQGENTIPNNPFVNPANVLQDPQGDTENFSIYIPYNGVPTSKVTLRKPEMDNRDRNAYTRVNHETRGGKLIVYADPQWPNVRTLAVTIIGLIESKVDEFQDFMYSTIGQEIGLTDWEGRLWKGIITNPNEAATQDGKSRWTITFEFEGELTDIEQPGEDDGGGTPMNLTQAVSVVIA